MLPVVSQTWSFRFFFDWAVSLISICTLCKVYKNCIYCPCGHVAFRTHDSLCLIFQPFLVKFLKFKPCGQKKSHVALWSYSYMYLIWLIPVVSFVFVDIAKGQVKVRVELHQSFTIRNTVLVQSSELSRRI